MKGTSFHERIAIDPRKRFGRPCVKGTRIAVEDVLTWLASGMSASSIIKDFPELAKEDIQACLAYAARRERLHRSLP